MKSHHPKLKTPARPFFSCCIFGHCTHSVVLNPTTPHRPDPHPPPPPSSSSSSSSQPPPPPPPRPPPPPPESDVRRHHPSSSSSSSSSTSQSFTQWKFPLPDTPRASAHPVPPPSTNSPELPATESIRGDRSPQLPCSSLAEVLHAAELQLSSGSDQSRLAGLQLLERSLVPDPLPAGPRCPAAVLEAVVAFLMQTATARAAAKVLLALSLAEPNRLGAVQAGAVGAIVEALAGMEVAAAERALAALELLCTVEEGAAALRAHALAVPALVEAMGKMGGRGKECAISVMAAVFGGNAGGEGPPAAVAQAVVLALQGECTARGRRKGAQLLKALKENGRLDMS